MSTAVRKLQTGDWQYSEWQYFYADALSNKASRCFPERLSSAEKAIVTRMRELRGSSHESAEWLAITEALQALQRLKKDRLMSWFNQPCKSASDPARSKAS